MRCLVTGSSGLVGRHMSAELIRRGYDVTGVDVRDGEYTTHVMDAVDWFHMDRSAIHTIEPERFTLAVHCAYHVGGRAMIDGVPDVLSANVELDAALFRWALIARPERILYFSSSAVYPVSMQGPNDPWSGISWDDEQPNTHRLVESDASTDLCNPMGVLPDAKYGWAKLNGERLAEAARESGLNVTVVRPASGCAPDQDDTYPFVAIAKRVLSGQNPLTLWGTEPQARDFIDISDVVNGALAVVASGTTDPVNLCNGRATGMGELASMLWQEAHGNLDDFHPSYDASKPMGVSYRVLSPNIMLTHYIPTVSLEEMVRNVVAHLRSVA